jgi:enterochelin esterase family protein
MMRPASVFRGCGWLLVGFMAGLPLGAASAGLPSPEVHPDRTVTFRLAWPGPGPVELVFRGPNQHDFPRDVYPMQRDAAGGWAAAIGPAPPGVHFYKFRIDGLALPDPANPVVQDFFNGPWSRFEVADAQPQPWTPRAGIPHGRVELRTYPSKILGEERPVWVYVPPGGRPVRPTAAWPVLYLFHGSTYDERSWVELGRVREIMDALIAERRAGPLLVVMPFGYSARPVSPAIEPPKDYASWARHVIGELRPWIEREYPVSPRREDHAVAGLSLGGAQALRIGLSHPDAFAWIGAFSAAEHGTETLPALAAASMAAPAVRPALVWFGCGRGDRLFTANRGLCARLAHAGLPTVWREFDGRHTWNVWRQCLSEFVLQLFSPASATAMTNFTHS